MMTQTPLTQEQLASLQQQADEFSKTFANAQYEMGEAQKFMMMPTATQVETAMPRGLRFCLSC